MEGHDESEAMQEAFEKILPAWQKELRDVYMDNLTWMKALKKDPETSRPEKDHGNSR